MRADRDGAGLSSSRGAAPPLGIAIIGVESLERSTLFYRDVVGLDASEPSRWHGRAFESHWCLPAGSEGEAVLLTGCGSDVGRILLAEFHAPARVRVRANAERVFLGHANLNFYTADVARSVGDLLDAGCTSWTDPVAYVVGADEGVPTEVIVEGPDGVLFNLVQPEGDPGTPVGEIRRFFDERGATRTGLSEVVTSGHAVRSIDDALRLYVGVLGQEIWLDAIFSQPPSNRLLSLPEDARSRVTFVIGSHPFGKVALIEAQNYDVDDLVGRAVAPNVGYLAMSFEVADLDATLAACQTNDVELASELHTLEVPGLGPRRAAMVETPGSGALVQLLEVLSPA